MKLKRQKWDLMYAAVKYMQRRVVSTPANRFHNRLKGGQQFRTIMINQQLLALNSVVKTGPFWLRRLQQFTSDLRPVLHER